MKASPAVTSPLVLGVVPRDPPGSDGGLLERGAIVTTATMDVTGYRRRFGVCDGTGGRGATCQGGYVLAQRLDVRAQRFQLVGASAPAIGRPPSTDTLCSTPHHLQIPLVVRHCIAFT